MEICEYGLEIEKNGRSILCVKEIHEYENNMMNSGECIAELLNERFRLGYQAEEQIYLIAMNSKCRILGLFKLSQGTVDQSLLRPREVMIRALLCGATSIILAHNHPSQDVQPSSADLTITQRMKEAAELIGIPLLDHVIVSADHYFSFREENMIREED